MAEFGNSEFVAENQVVANFETTAFGKISKNLFTNTIFMYKIYS